MQPIVARMYIISEPTSSLLLPYLSLTVPISICPIANPNIDIVKDNCVKEFVVSKSFDSEGNAGKYISVTKGPKADRKPNVTSI